MKDLPKPKPKISAYNQGALPVILSLCRISGVRRIIDEKCGWSSDIGSISPGILAETLIAAILCGCRPMYKVEHFYQRKNYIRVFYKGETVNGKQITWKQLNDDAYAGLLDQLSRANCVDLFETICLQMLQYHTLDITLLHCDTTSISVEGIYAIDETNSSTALSVSQSDEHKPSTNATERSFPSPQPPSKERFKVTHGHSKDHRPDLKQVKFGVSVQKDGLPISGQVLSGNTADKSWTPPAIERIDSMLSKNGYKDTIFVADSAVISVESIHNFSKRDMQFISRMPETFNLPNDLKMAAWELDEWEDVGVLAENQKNAAHYKTWRTKCDVEGELYDFIVVYSSKLNEKKERTLLKNREEQQKGFEKKSKELSKNEFFCEEDARKAGEMLLKLVNEKGFHGEVKVQEVVTLKYPTKGRPKKGEVPNKLVFWRVNVEVGSMKEEVYEQKKKEASTFVLICRIKEKLGSADILKYYKNQDRVEQNFRFLKMPQIFGVVYTKIQSRVESLGYIFLIVLLLAKYLEYRVRVSMQRTKGMLLIGGQKVPRPSAKTILEELSEVLVYNIDGEIEFAHNISDKVLQMIKWTGFDERVYIVGEVIDIFLNGWDREMSS